MNIRFEFDSVMALPLFLKHQSGIISRYIRCRSIHSCHYDKSGMSFSSCFILILHDAVVYLDADTIVVQSIEDLFKCGKFCANLKHSERLNSGVMVLEPSETLFNDMMRKVNTLYSYTGGRTFLRA